MASQSAAWQLNISSRADRLAKFRVAQADVTPTESMSESNWTDRSWIAASASSGVMEFSSIEMSHDEIRRGLEAGMLIWGPYEIFNTLDQSKAAPPPPQQTKTHLIIGVHLFVKQ